MKKIVAIGSKAASFPTQTWTYSFGLPWEPKQEIGPELRDEDEIRKIKLESEK